MTFEELVAENRELHHRLERIVAMATDKIALLKGDATPTRDLWEAVDQLHHIKAMAEGKMPHPF